MQAGLESSRQDWVVLGQARWDSVDELGCSAWLLRGTKSQYQIHRNKLKI